MGKIKKVAFEAKSFIYCKTKKQAKELLELARNDIKLSFIHEKSTAVMEYEPDSNFWDKPKKDCYYSLYYRKRADENIVNELDGKVFKCKKVIKKDS